VEGEAVESDVFRVHGYYMYLKAERFSTISGDTLGLFLNSVEYSVPSPNASKFYWTFSKRNYRSNQYEPCEAETQGAIFSYHNPSWGTKDALHINFEELPISNFIDKGTVSFLVQVGLAEGDKRDDWPR